MYKRSEYTYEDKKKIVEYIITHKCYLKLRGNSFWQEMESELNLGRTWQSLKEHFRKKIIDMIHTFDIPQEEKLRIKSGWMSSQTKKIYANGKMIKRPRYHNLFVNEFSDDDSDSASYIKQNTNLNRRKVVKSKSQTDRCQRSPSEFNFFSDDDVHMVSSERNQIIEEDFKEQESPDLLNRRPMSTDSTPDLYMNTKILEGPSSSIVVDSDSNEISVVSLESTVTENANVSSGKTEEFSAEDDALLLNYMRLDKTYLERRNQLCVYNYFHEIYPNSKSPRKLRKRFLYHIFPNICKYSLSHNEMVQFYKNAEVNIPDNLKSLLKAADSNIHQENSSNCEHDLRETNIDSIYCHVMLNNQLHFFVSTLDKSDKQEKLTNILSKRFHVPIENIHYTDFASFFLVEQVNKFRNAIYKQYRKIITDSLEDKYRNVDLAAVIRTLEVSAHVFSTDDEKSDSESDASSESLSAEPVTSSEKIVYNTEFKPTENSTPQRQESQNVNKINNKSSTQTTKQQITSVEETSCGNLSMVLNSIESEIKLENHSDTMNTTDELSQSFGFTAENDDSSNVHSKKECEEKQNRTSITQPDSQCLESIPSQKGSEIRNVLTSIVDDPINLNHSVEFPSSVETFHTATGFSQNLD